jgi:lipoprotein-releasing system permease protein
MKWFTYLALKQLFPSGKKVSFFSAMSILGVALGVMVLFVVQSVMEGFQSNIRTTLVETQGDILIQSPHIIHDSDNLESLLQQFPEVTAMAKYAYGVVMLKHDSRPVFPVIKGIDVENEMKVINLKNFIKRGDLENLEVGGIVLSRELAQQIRADIGSEVEIYSPTIFENFGDDEIPLPKTMEVVAIYETGYHHADRNIALVSLDTMQELYDLASGIHGISIKLRAHASPEKVAFELNQCLQPPVRATSWQEINQDFLFALKTEKTMMLFVLIFILLIAAFSIMGSLTISVIRKTREIGLISALGGTVRQCAACFIIEGFIIGVIGSALGISLGMLVLKFRNDVVAVFAKLCRIDDFMLKFYSFANMPAQYGARDVLIISVAAVVMCCIAGMFPAIKAAKIRPAEALRNE